MISIASKRSELQHFLEFDDEVVVTQIARNTQFSKIFPAAIFGAKNLKNYCDHISWIFMHRKNGKNPRPKGTRH
jgi:hypothetical protein